MKRRVFLMAFALLLAGLQIFGTTADAAQRRKRHRRKAVVVVHKGFPLRRPLRRVYVYPVRRPYRVAPRIYLPLVTWGGILSLAVPGRDLLIWEDGQTLLQNDGWAEFTLNCENTGTKLWLEIVSGRARFDWAEVVFENGESQIVEMQEYIRDPGHYVLLDFANGRMVDHVRLVAQAETVEARVVLKMQK